jgi:hypothetical protein
MSKSVFNVAWIGDEPDEFKSKWCMLRAIEWARLPIFVAQSIAPIALLVYNPAYVAAAVVVASWLWIPIRMSFVSLWLASYSSLLVSLKWPISLGCGVYLAVQGNYLSAVFAACWPFVTLVLSSFVPGAPIGVLQQRFALKVMRVQP